MRVIIDRFEGKCAVCEKEDGTMIDININKIPSGAKEGNVLSINNEKIIIDISRTKARQEEIAELTKDMWK